MEPQNWMTTTLDTNDYAVALCWSCDKPTLTIPIKEWSEAHNPRDGATYFTPIYDRANASYTCNCDHDEDEINEPEVVNYVYKR
jgi:hypothetical protein